MINITRISGLSAATMLKGFLLLLSLSFAISMIIHHLTHGKFMLPGDLYKIKAPRVLYIPFGSTLFFTILLFVILTSKILGIILAIAMIYMAYRAVFKRGF